MGTSPRMIPYMSHMMTDMVANANIRSDISEADFVFHVLITCGKKVMAEILPAAIPRSCMEVISSLQICRCEIRQMKLYSKELMK
jgi:hypothetical protein